MNQEEWTYGKFETRNIFMPMITVGGTRFVDTTDWTFGKFETRNILSPMITVSNQLPSLPIEPEPGSEAPPPEPDAGPQR